MSDAPKQQIAAALVELALERYKLGRAHTGESFAVEIDGPNIARPLRGSNSLRARLSATYAEMHGKCASSSQLADAMLALDGRALALPDVELGLRVRWCDDELIVDLGDEDGRAVAIGAGGWDVLDRSPVLFWRTRLTAPLPEPSPAGDLDELRSHIHVNDDAWPLVVAYLVTALDPTVSCPIMHLAGEQGTAKSTTARRIQAMVDPSNGDLHGSPDDAGDFRSWVTNSRVVALDNLSTLPPWLSDALCRVTTGTGFSKRMLYSDNDLVVIKARRALIITAIEAGALRGDLADRLVAIELELIPAHARRSDTELDAAFADAWPRLLGGLYTLTAEVLALRPHVIVDELPRMADYGRTLATVDAILGTKGLATYLEAGQRLAQDMVEGDAVGSAVQRFAGSSGGWTGTIGELLAAITPERPGKTWPADATRLSQKLRRIAPALRDTGIGIDFRKPNGKRVVDITPPDAHLDLDGTRVAGETPSDPQRPSSDPAPHADKPRSAPSVDARDAKDAESLFSTCIGGDERERDSETAPPASLATLDPRDTPAYRRGVERAKADLAGPR